MNINQNFAETIVLFVTNSIIFNADMAHQSPVKTAGT